VELGCDFTPQERVPASNVNQDKQENATAKSDWHIDPEPSAQDLTSSRKSRLRCGNFVDRQGAGSQIGLPICRQTRQSRGPMKQFSSKPGLQPGNGFSDRRLGKSQSLCRQGEASPPCCSHKNTYAIKGVLFGHARLHHDLKFQKYEFMTTHYTLHTGTDEASGNV
jgi:hypothetical protein